MTVVTLEVRIVWLWVVYKEALYVCTSEHWDIS